MTAAKWLALLAIFCVPAVGACADDKTDYAKMMVGKWEVTKADPGTVPDHAVVEFTKDGKFKVTGTEGGKEMTFEGTYKVDGSKFTFTLKVGGEERTQTITITKISENEMSTKDKDDKVVELKRKK